MCSGRLDARLAGDRSRRSHLPDDRPGPGAFHAARLRPTRFITAVFHRPTVASSASPPSVERCSSIEPTAPRSRRLPCFRAPSDRRRRTHPSCRRSGPADKSTRSSAIRSGSRVRRNLSVDHHSCRRHPDGASLRAGQSDQRIRAGRRHAREADQSGSRQACFP
jgi:hypothetical protein